MGGDQGREFGGYGCDVGFDQATQGGWKIRGVADGEHEVADQGDQCAEASDMGFGQVGRDLAHAGVIGRGGGGWARGMLVEIAQKLDQRSVFNETVGTIQE